MTDRAFLGLLDGAPRLVVSRPGFAVLASLGDPAKLAFDSAWLEAQKVLVSGAAVASGSADGDGYWFLASFPVQASPPVVWVYSRSAPLGLSYTMGGVTPQTTWPVKVTTSEVRVRAGNGYNGFTRPTDTLTYVVFANGILG